MTLDRISVVCQLAVGRTDLVYSVHVFTLFSARNGQHLQMGDQRTRTNVLYVMTPTKLLSRTGTEHWFEVRNQWSVDLAIYHGCISMNISIVQINTYCLREGQQRNYDKGLKISSPQKRLANSLE